MLSVESWHEPAPLLPPQAAEPARPVLSLRRLNITFAPQSRRNRGGAASRRDSEATVGIPTYSFITLRAGVVSRR